MLRQPSHERFAAGELVQAHPFVRLVRLLDVARTTDDRGHRRVVEQRGFGAVGDLVRRVRLAARAADVGDRVAAVIVEAGQGRDVVELDVRCRIDRVHRRQVRLRVAFDVGDERIGIVERQVTDLEFERAIARHDIERG